MNKFNSEEFIRNILHIDPDDDFLCNEGNLNDQKRNFIKIDFLNKKYDVAVVKDYYNEEEMLIFEIKDVTDISIEEEKLKTSELRYKTLMDILSDGIIIHDGTNVSYMNKIAMDMLKLNSYTCTDEKIIKQIDKSSKDEFRHNIFALKNDLTVEERSQLKLENGRIVDFVSTTLSLNNKQMILSIMCCP